MRNGNRISPWGVLALVVCLVIALAAVANPSNSKKSATSSTVKSTASAPTTSSKQTTLTVEWHRQCPKGFHFCADYPYVTGSIGFGHEVFSSATSQTGKSNAFSSDIYRNRATGRVCGKQVYSECEETQGGDGIDEFYFVDVFRSKYTDPWQAITAINSGVKNPKRISIQGNLAASFTKGLYGHAGLVIYHRGLVYYLETGTIRYRGTPRYTKRFLASIKLL